MKRSICLLLTIFLILGVFSACSKPQENEQSEVTPSVADGSKSPDSSDSSELPVLRVAVQPFYISMAVQYILDQQLDVKNGFKIETVVFPTGAPMNEAIASDLFDVGTTGAALVAAVAQYNAKVIANHIDASGGNEIYVRPDSQIAQVKGSNPTYPDILGDADSVRGKKVLCTTGTTLQLLLDKWLEKIGLKESDVEFVNMDIAQCYQAFVAGEGDIVCLASQFSPKAPENGWEFVADFKTLDTKNLEAIIATDKAYKNKKDLLKKFLEVLFEANEALESDFDLKCATLKAWNEANAKDVPEADIKKECTFKPLITKDAARNIEFGVNEMNLAEFWVNIGKLESSKLSLFETNVTDEILQEVLAE